MTAIDFSDIQGNTLYGYRSSFDNVRHLVVRIRSQLAAKTALAAMIDGNPESPQITFSEQSPRRAELTASVNIGITAHGLSALGVPQSSLDSFPPEFRQGMPARAAWLGDVGASAPKNWIAGLGQEELVDLILTIHGQTPDDLDRVTTQILAMAQGKAFDVQGKGLDGAVFTEPGREKDVHFGYRDGISKVKFEGVHPPDPAATHTTLTPLGALLLGYPGPTPDVHLKVPQPYPLGKNGTFNAFRVLAQDVQGFERFLGDAALETNSSAEEVAAKMCGRWRNGVALALAGNEETSTTGDLDADDFGYQEEDPDGHICPLGSHIRRTNPRDAQIVQRGTNRARVLVRRGMPYGPIYDPNVIEQDGIKRGLLGNFMCASLSSQFEAMHADWLNLGLQDPRITGTSDPLVGANEYSSGRFEWTTSDGRSVTMRGLQRFVHTAGGAYCFLPSRTAIQLISGGDWCC